MAWTVVFTGREAEFSLLGLGLRQAEETKGKPVTGVTCSHLIRASPTAQCARAAVVLERSFLTSALRWTRRAREFKKCSSWVPTPEFLISLFWFAFRTLGFATPPTPSPTLQEFLCAAKLQITESEGKPGFGSAGGEAFSLSQSSRAWFRKP